MSVIVILVFITFVYTDLGGILADKCERLADKCEHLANEIEGELERRKKR